jgi:glutathione synthase/RimK-type ligase-like ATP-grasp enzyme
MHEYDVTLLTESKYVNIGSPNLFESNILKEDGILRNALEAKGLRVHRTNWDDKNFDWRQTRTVLFRTPWDYFRRFDEFSRWLDETSVKTKFINPLETIRWNIDKHYLLDLERAGLNIPPTILAERGDTRTLEDLAKSTSWKDFILKPAVSGAAWHTYKFNRENISEHEAIYRELISNRSMLLQEFQYSIQSKGEAALMVFGGKYSHAVLKRAKEGDFRVQDDFGGTVLVFSPSADEIEFAEFAAKLCEPLPTYARADIMWDNNDRVCISELELIEPELWFRSHPPAAVRLADIINIGIKKSFKE